MNATMDSTRPPRTIGVAFFMKDAYPLFNPACAGVFGGAEVDLYFTACALAKNKKYRVAFFVGDYGQHDVETREGVRLIRLKYSNLQQYNKWYHKIIRRLYIIRAFLRDDSDVLITKTASDTLAFMVLFGRILKGKRVIFKLGSDIDADMDFWKQKDPCIYYPYKYTLPFVDAIVCQTAAQQQMIAPRLAARSLIIKNGFPIPEERHEVDREHILWVSRLDYMKRPELFVQLARELPQERFVMIMPGSGAGRGELIESLCTADNLTLLEGVPFGSMQGYFNRAKCLVNTSAFEGFPNTFIQSCLAGTPILSFAVNPDGFIDAYDLGCCCHNSMAQAVSFIKSLDAAALRRYGQNAARYVREHHSIVDKIRQYEQLIDNLLSM
jgi:glycosyltransferase involved in cell wall biosynthesis